MDIRVGGVDPHFDSGKDLGGPSPFSKSRSGPQVALN